MARFCTARRLETSAFAGKRLDWPQTSSSWLRAFQEPFFALRRKSVEGIDTTRYISFRQQRTRGIGRIGLLSARCNHEEERAWKRTHWSASTLWR